MATIKENIKKITFQKVVYPAIVVLFVAVIALVLSLSARFLTREINRSLSAGVAKQEADLVIDMEGFTAVAKKIGITITEQPQEAAEETVPAATISAPPPVVESPAIAPETLPQEPPPVVPVPEVPAEAPVIERSSVAISVLNSTKTPGLAGKMKSALLAAGFTSVATGNQSPALTETVVRMKALLGTLRDEIQDIVGAQQYQFSVEELDLLSENDAVIIIGNR
jgi:hypothetical protein